jgi:two-component system chemotaxis response regulator CheY
MKTILFVDDDAVIVQVYRARLLREGFDVEVAQDGLTAMKLLMAEKPDLVVLDLMMPKFSGADVLKFIRAEPALKSTPVIILSNAYMTDLARQAADAGAELALLKSNCTPAQLLDAINKLLTGGAPQAKPSTRLAVECSLDELVRF